MAVQPWERINIFEGSYPSPLEMEQPIKQPKEPTTWVERLHREHEGFSLGDFISKLAAPLPVGRPRKINSDTVKKNQESYRLFKEMTESVGFEELAPPQNLTISIKTNTQTFNHVNDYVIHNDIVWYRRNGQTDLKWRPMFFDGNKPLIIQADGANLIIVDSEDGINPGYIHYKKVLKERLRIFEVEALQNGPPDRKKTILAQTETHAFTIKDDTIWVGERSGKKVTKWKPFHYSGWPDRTPVTLSVNGTILTIHDNENEPYQEDVSPEGLQKALQGQSFPYRYHYAYSAITKDTKNNWKDQWFTLPFLENALSIFKEKRLKLPENIIDFAISNRGGFSACWEDFADCEHPSCAGSEQIGQKANFSAVTGCYAALKGEPFIRFADPWLPGGFNLTSFPLLVSEKKIDLPSDFTLERLRASASMLFISGINGNGERRLYCSLADFDTTRLNPFLPKGKVTPTGEIKHHRNTEDHPVKPGLRVYPEDYKHLSADQLWVAISLDGLEDQNVDHHMTTILQTGPGNDAKELRIASADKNAQGYYMKSLRKEREGLPWTWQSTAAVAA